MVENTINNIQKEAEDAWKMTIAQLKMTMDKQTFSTLIGSAKLVDYRENTFIIGVQNSITRDWLEQRLTESIVRILNGMMNEPQTVDFVLLSAENAKKKQPPANEQAPTAPTKISSGSQSSRHVINGKYSFDNFVIGPHNSLAAAACKAVSEFPATSYNPLFIYSGVGLGKTHLLHAIGNALERKEMSVLYVSSEEFTNDYINAIQKHENITFRDKYRNADVLLIDDIQFLIGKESTQEEFFHTFNSLYQMDKQIVISSDRSPKTMTTLDERMRSRFEWGLTVDIQPPDLETRIAILYSKLEKMGRKVPEDVLDLIAKKINNNVRELEGAITRVLAISDLCMRPLDRDLVLTSLTDFMPAQAEVSPKDIIFAVSNSFGIPVEKIMSRDRTKAVSLSRQVVMYLMREESNISLPQIGMELGGRDHSTVIHGCEKVANLLESDNRFRKQVLKARDQLYGAQPMAA